MNRPYKEMFDNLPASDALRQEVLNMTKQERTTKKIPRLPKVTAIAVIAAVLLVGTAFATNLFGIRDIFAEQWQEETGNEISVDQLGLIDQLTQEIGASDTDNGITVTLDSVARGEGVLWLLLEIDGEIPPESRYATLACSMALSPDVTNGISVFSCEEAGRREDGSMMMLIRYSSPLMGEGSYLDAYDASLKLKDLYWDGELAAAGNWEIDYSLDAMETADVLVLEDPVVVRGISRTNPDPVDVEYYDIRITPTEIWLHTDTLLDDETTVIGQWGLQMENGSTIIHSGGATYDHPDGGKESIYYWRVPVNLSEVTALTFGDMVIPVI